MNRLYFLSIIFFGAVLSLNSCKEKNSTSKPIEPNRIAIPQYGYISAETPYSKFDRSELSQIEQNNEANKNWLNINYPSFNATIYCTYLPITEKKINELIAESHKLAFSHSMMADNIAQTSYSDPDNKVYGIIYTIEGNVATPCQFYLTDSTSNFFRGSLYYNSEVKADSVAEITQAIRRDIKTLTSTFRWMKSQR